MKEYKVENYSDFIKEGVVSFETAKLISSSYNKYCDKSYTYREAIKEDIPDKYKKYEDWYPYEIREELGDEKANEILETVWYLTNFGCYNKEYNETFVAPTFQEIVDWMIKHRGIVLGIAYLNLSQKWIWTSQSIYTPQGTDVCQDEIFQYKSSKTGELFDTWQEAMDTAIQTMFKKTSDKNTLNNN